MCTPLKICPAPKSLPQADQPMIHCGPPEQAFINLTDKTIKVQGYMFFINIHRLHEKLGR